jgi:hypothetical protein
LLTEIRDLLKKQWLVFRSEVLLLIYKSLSPDKSHFLRA